MYKDADGSTTGRKNHLEGPTHKAHFDAQRKVDDPLAENLADGEDSQQQKKKATQLCVDAFMRTDGLTAPRAYLS